ncbi:hypothetical protein [Allopseudospirillum japonicum]|nr:hypothetical protein [Allopseudospirillum japonicum]
MSRDHLIDVQTSTGLALFSSTDAPLASVQHLDAYLYLIIDLSANSTPN